MNNKKYCLMLIFNRRLNKLNYLEKDFLVEFFFIVIFILIIFSFFWFFKIYKKCFVEEEVIIIEDVCIRYI